MEVGRELLFFFSALGAFNGLLMGLYFLFFARPKHISNYFLGAFLLSLSIRIGKSVFFYFNSQLSSVFLQFGLAGCLLIGPFLFLYLKSILKPNNNVRKTWWYQAAIVLPIMLVLFTMYDRGEDYAIWRKNIVLTIYLTWLIYSLFAAYTAREMLKKAITPKVKLSNMEIWMTSIFVGNMLIWNGKKNNAIPDIEANRLLVQLKGLMSTKELYKNPNLKLADVANELQVLPHTISKLLNEYHGHNFSHFLNEYRIEQAKKLILSNQDYTFEGIGYDSGFNSKSTFFATFKKFTGTTPAKFRKSVAN